MSTPFIGLSRVNPLAEESAAPPVLQPNTPLHKKSSESLSQRLAIGLSQWVPSKSTAQELDLDERSDFDAAKLNLITLLKDHFGIEGLQVGTFYMHLTPLVPTRSLLDAAHELSQKLQAEPASSNLTTQQSHRMLNQAIQYLQTSFNQ